MFKGHWGRKGSDRGATSRLAGGARGRGGGAGAYMVQGALWESRAPTPERDGPVASVATPPSPPGTAVHLRFLVS